jgi:hypothetical protein
MGTGFRLSDLMSRQPEYLVSKTSPGSSIFVEQY